MSHSIIAPSSAYIWGAPGGCTGYPAMAAAYPETEESEDSREGTAVHELAALMLTGKEPETPVGWLSSNGVVLTEEMVEAAEIYVFDVFNACRYPTIERRVAAPLTVHPESYGTPDAYYFDGEELIVWDFKFGRLLVEAFEAWQLINYAAAILEELGIDGHADQRIRVRLRIVQPRAFHRDGPVREWSINAASLRSYFNIIATNAAISLGPDAKLRSGEHCRYCPARHACPAALEGGVQLFEVARQVLPIELSPQALGTQLSIVKRARKQLEYLESGYEEQVKALMKSGINVPGFRAEPATGREKWTKPVEEIVRLGDLLGHDLREPKVKTPNAARKLGIDAIVIAAYSETPRTGTKIVADNGNKAKEIFNNE